MPTFPLGRHPNPPDSRDALFPMQAHLLTVPEAQSPPASKSWRGQALRVDQGNVGACVGYAGANWEGHLPIATTITNQTGMDLYTECKKVDGSPNTEGTYDRALAKVLLAQGRLASYRWPASMEDVRLWVLTVGPVMVGTNWTDDMFNPDANHILHATGAVAGGHEWLVKGYRQMRINGQLAAYYRMRNSWGPNWGDRGEAWISKVDLENLIFNGGGDAFGAVEKRP